MLWRAEEHEPLIDRGWDAADARAAIADIVADAEAALDGDFWPGHPLDDVPVGAELTSLYLGGAGMVWALHRLGSERDLSPLIARLLERHRDRPDFPEQAHAPSLWMGETGLLVAAAEIGSPAFDRARLGALIHANRAHPTWELMWGSPGTMLAARAHGLAAEWRDSAARLWAAREDDGLWTQTIYGWVARVLGPAHGMAGNVHALRGAIAEPDLRALVTEVLEASALRSPDGELINWPPALGDVPEKATIRVQWCHGAPGLVATIGDLMPPELARGGGELTWRAGPLRKGPNLCHGTAGNGYAFLRLFTLTGDELWLDRARRFAVHAIAQVRQERARLGRGRYTLWTGDIGVALYLRSCLSGDPAVPSIDDL